MDYYSGVLNTFLGLERGSSMSMQGQKALGFDQKYRNLCSEDEQWTYKFGTT